MTSALVILARINRKHSNNKEEYEKVKKRVKQSRKCTGRSKVANQPRECPSVSKAGVTQDAGGVMTTDQAIRNQDDQPKESSKPGRQGED